jgi:hypothetical protein
VRGYVPPDPDGGVSEVQFAVVYAPKHAEENKNLSKRVNKRFSANCVEIKASAEEAFVASNIQNNLYPAKVLGPSKSSEGQFIYYLVEWIEDNKQLRT